MDWKECKKRKLIKEIKTDSNLVNSLIESSKNKRISNEKLILDNITASTKVTLAYESLREILEAIAIKRGFKIYNHECFCSFLEEICKDTLSSKEFDRFRKIRNKLVYYGEKIDLVKSKQLVKEIFSLRNLLIKNYIYKN